MIEYNFIEQLANSCSLSIYDFTCMLVTCSVFIMYTVDTDKFVSWAQMRDQLTLLNIFSLKGSGLLCVRACIENLL